MKFRFPKLLCLLSLVIFNFVSAQEEDPLDVQLGEKLFLEDRFSQGYFELHENKVNKKVSSGDPILDKLQTPGGFISHPQKGSQVSCSSCHLVDQASEIQKNLVFTYNDFSPRSLIPVRDDGLRKTTRNSMNMVLSSLKKDRPLHWDGEFFSATDVACASLIGRNMGWKDSQAKIARRHIVNVLRKDNGSYPGASDIIESYNDSFARLGLDLASMTDTQVYRKTCELMATYMENIDFSRDDKSFFNLSAYDQFLALNGIRRGLKANETEAQYQQYIKDQLSYKKDWKWLEPKDLNFHQHTSAFGKKELRGMKTFFGKAQCASCHTPPNFSNFLLHGTGVSQLEYDQIHGKGAFAKVSIPSWEDRNKFREKYFVSSEDHPSWQGVFRRAPDKIDKDFLDLGAWNILGHPDKNSVQIKLKKTICKAERMKQCQWSDNEYLSRSVAIFKTPTLRSLGQSAPYFHNGMAKDLIDVLANYMAASKMAKDGSLINADPMLKVMKLEPSSFESLKLFMESLDEDYD